MIIAKIAGGLGNQMFQYAAAKALSLKHEVPLFLDLSYYDQKNLTDTPRLYMLHHFSISGKTADSKMLKKFELPLNRSLRLLYRMYRYSLLSNCRMQWLYETTLDYNKRINRCSKNAYLQGYWQSEKYFKSICNVIRNEFVVKDPPTGKNLELLELIKSRNSIAVHIRRGDYYSNQQINATHGTCNLEYYKSAFGRIEAQEKKPHYFIFSDEPDWVRKNFTANKPITIVDHNNENMVYEDLRLMVSCNHFIIANSSLSWWGAWLNMNKQKMVFAPKKWMLNKKFKYEDRFPTGWNPI